MSLAKKVALPPDYGPGKPQAHCSICAYGADQGYFCSLYKVPVGPDRWCASFKPKPKQT